MRSGESSTPARTPPWAWPPRRAPSSWRRASPIGPSPRSSSWPARTPPSPSPATWRPIVGEERVLRFPERADHPLRAQAGRRRVRSPAGWRPPARCKSGREVRGGGERPALSCAACCRPKRARRRPDRASARARSLSRCRRSRASRSWGTWPAPSRPAGYANTGELDGPGTFAVRGGTIDVFPGNLVLSGAARLLRRRGGRDPAHRAQPRARPSPALPAVEMYPVSEFPTSAAERCADARRALETPALTNPALRDVLEKLEGGLALRRRRRGAAVICTRSR